METKIISIKRVKNNKLQAELVDVIEKRVNVLSRLNKGDVAFNPGNYRHAWFPITINSLIELGVNSSLISKVEKLIEGEKVECEIINPKIDNERLRIKIVETTIPNEWQRSNILKAAKQLDITEKVLKSNVMKHPETTKYVGSTGYFLTDEGHYIFVNASVEIESQLTHTFIEGVLCPSPLLNGIGAILATQEVVQEKEGISNF